MTRFKFSPVPRRTNCLLNWDGDFAVDSANGKLSPVTVDGKFGTFTRAGDVYAVDANGRVYKAPYGMPARHHRYNSSSGLWTPQGVLLERAVQNLILQSQTLGTTWTQNHLTIGANTATAPDGTSTGDKIREDNTTNDHNITQSVTVVSGPFIFSVYLRAGERTAANIYMTDNVAGAVQVNVDLSTGALSGASSGGSWTNLSYRSSYHFNGWWRVEVGGTRGAGTSCSCSVYLLKSGVTNYAGTTGEGLYAWGAQLESALAASSYITTTTVAVTRPTSAILLPLAPRFQAMTFHARGVYLGGTAGLAWEYHPSGAGAVDIAVNSTGASASHNSAAGTVSAFATASPAIGDLFDVRVVLGADGSVTPGISLNEGAEATHAASDALAPDSVEATATLGLGGGTTTNFCAQRAKALFGSATLAECLAVA